MSTTRYPFALIAFLALDGLLCSQARSAPARGEATVVIREGVAIRALQAKEGADRASRIQAEHSVRTVTRPCDPAEPTIRCTFVLIEMQ